MTTQTTEYDGGYSEDGALARAYLAGDQRAFDLLYEKHWSNLVGYLCQLVRDRALAEDLAQEAMLNALRSLNKFEPERPMWPWLARIARNVVIADQVRRAKEEPGRSPVEEMIADVPTVVDATEAFITRAAIDECLAYLPKRQRRALVLRYFLDKDANSIAAEFGISRGALEVLLNRGRANLAREYRRRNMAVVPVFGPLAAKFRRVFADVCARFNAATNAGFGLASDMALSAAITVGGIGIVAGAIGQNTVHRHDANSARDGIIAAAPSTDGVPVTPLKADKAAVVRPAGFKVPEIAGRPGDEVVVAPAPDEQAPGQSGEQAPYAPPVAGDPDDPAPIPLPTPTNEPVPEKKGTTTVKEPLPQATPPTPPETISTGVKTNEDAPADADAEGTLTPGDATEPGTDWGFVQGTIGTPLGESTIKDTESNGSDPSIACKELGLTC